MTRHPTARRVHRDSEPDDAFVAGVLETTVWAKQHSQKLIIGGIIAAVLIAATLLFVMNRRSNVEQAAGQLTLVRAAALSGDPQAAIPALEQFLDDFGGTPQASEVRLMLGRSYLEAGRAQDAINTVESTARDVNSEYGANAAYLLAFAHEATQEPHRAEEVFLRLGENSNFLYIQQDALDNVARLRLQSGNPAGAAEIYQRLIDLSPESSSERQVFELRLGEAMAAAAAGNTGPAAPATGAAPTTGTAPATPAAPATDSVPAPTTGN